MGTGIFSSGDIVRVPFPYTDRSTRQRRPALVISQGGVGRGRSLLWVLMVTAAENSGWPGDVVIPEPHDRTGLPIPSIVRVEKIASVAASQVDRVGSLSDQTLAAVRRRVDGILADALS